MRKIYYYRSSKDVPSAKYYFRLRMRNNCGVFHYPFVDSSRVFLPNISYLELSFTSPVYESSRSDGGSVKNDKKTVTFSDFQITKSDKPRSGKTHSKVYKIVRAPYNVGNKNMNVSLYLCCNNFNFSLVVSNTQTSIL